MICYRVYTLDEWGRIGFAEDFQAESDEQALWLASDVSPRARRRELWEGRRLVATVDGEAWVLDPA